MIAAPSRLQERWSVVQSHGLAVSGPTGQLDCPPAIARLLAGRGIADTEAFFHPSLEQLGDPLCLLGVKEAVARIQLAVRNAEPVLIYGDYDVDGTIATVLLKTAIERIAPKETPAKVTWHVPHRIREGYGMQTGVLGRAAEDGIRLVISVDTGIRAFAAAAEAKALGLDLIVTDHHLPDDALGVPEAIAVINPAQPSCLSSFKGLCGAGVAFKLAHALLAAAAITPDQQLRLHQVILPSFLKLVAIATIADSVPLVGENRVIVSLGLRELRNPVQPGLRALMQVAKLPLDRSPSAIEVGFRLAPRINAAGRMDIADDVIALFLTRDPAEARLLAEKLDRLNQERRAVEAHALEAIEERLAQLTDTNGGLPASCIILDDPEWHRGVLGILASRIVDRTGRPALVLTHEGTGAEARAHGSGRSIAGFHLLDALTAVDAVAQGDPIFSRFGGHAHAVGFSLPSDRVAELRNRMDRHTAATLTTDVLCPELQCDVEVQLAEIDAQLWKWLLCCGPFGNGHAEPIFVTRGVTLASPVRFIKEKHICLEVEQAGFNSAEAVRFSALGWSRAIDWRARVDALRLRPGTILDLAYRITENQHEQFAGLQLELAGLKLAEDH